MTVSVLTPTCDRPLAFALCERWMARQTHQPDEWIVADGGQVPVVCTQGQTHLYMHGVSGYRNFIGNLQRATLAAQGEYLIWMEDDDWYAPTHIEQLLSQFTPNVLAVGDDRQHYYNLTHRLWRTFNNQTTQTGQGFSMDTNKPPLTSRWLVLFLSAATHQR